MRILVIEDNQHAALALKKVLVRAGYLVDTASSEVEGIYRARNWEYDAILFDILSPQMDGWKVLKELRATTKSPIIILTESNEVSLMIRSLDRGADDFVAKPFEVDALLARIRAVARRTFSQTQSSHDFGNVKIDLALKEVRRNGAVVELTSSEYRILVYLAQRAGSVVSRAEIIDAFSDDARDGGAGVLAVLICRLRKKLGKDIIVNRRNLGYMIAHSDAQISA